MPDSEVRVSALNRTLPPADEPGWRRGIKQQLESEIEKRVRDALSTPPTQRLQRRRQLAQDRTAPEVDLNSHLLDQSAKDRLKYRRFRALKPSADGTGMSYFLPSSSEPPVQQLVFRDRLSKSNQDEFPGVFGLENFSEGIKEIREDFTSVVNRMGIIKPKARHFYTKEGFLKAVCAGTLPPGGVRALGETGQYVDKYGVVRDSDGPFWPVDYVPLFPTPRFQMGRSVEAEPLSGHLPESDRTADNQSTPYQGKWRSTLIAYDSERTPRDFVPQAVTEDLCPSLVFESRFESGNLRQARRVGMYDYELVLQTDLYTRRHTQWYLFRVQNAQPGVTYRLTIVNLLKPDSLYNYGMRPLLYSQRGAEEEQRGWRRCGHHISYTKNLYHLSCPLLARSLHHYQLQWQMEFPYAEDTCYLAHCYPYTFTDLKADLARLATRADSKGHVRREVLCESRAGNSCFLLTITNFEREGPKKAVVVTSRVHPGESQASWMMRGLLEFLTGSHPAAQELRDRFVFKVVPMLNPDGVIVGNYRCSLAARDLNRNYRHPRSDTFPTIHAVKAMVQDLAANYEILLYCDLHGHSRKHNVFMYGNNTSTATATATATTTTTPGGGGGDKGAGEGDGAVRAFLSERLFPWLMASMCRDKFSFPSCKFHIQRCKESTGRVVMWRQLQVFNSFTLEASFSGSILNSSQRRHFNMHDLMDVGRALALTVLQYQQLQDDSVKQTQTIVEMTQAFTQQIVQRRGVKGASNTMLNSTAKANSTARTTATATHKSTSGPEHKSHMEAQMELVRADTEKWTAAVLSLLQNKPDLDLPIDLEVNLKERAGRKSSFQSSTRADGSEAEVTKGQGQGQPSVSAIDRCLSVLAALNVREMLEESDSSDSDSESEPEMKSGKEERKPRRKKKRKSRKRRDRDRQTKKQNAGERRHEGEGKKTRACSAAQKDVTPAVTLSKETPRGRPGGQFHSKYNGRHNGGLPCFTEERSAERAAKRVTDQHRKGSIDELKEMSFLSLEEPGGYVPPLPSHLFPPTPGVTQGNATTRSEPWAGAGEGEGEGALTRSLLMDRLARTGYSHADTLAQVHQHTGKLQGSQIPGHLPHPASNHPHPPSNHPHHHPAPAGGAPVNHVSASSALPDGHPRLPPIDDRGHSRHTTQESGGRTVLRRHSSPSTASSSLPRGHPDNRQQPLSSREPPRHRDNQATPRATVAPKAAFLAATERRPPYLGPGRAPLIRGLKAPDPRHSSVRN